ncbi:MAG: MG2 domain-containing protein [Thermoguttaceae bacterium]
MQQAFNDGNFKDAYEGFRSLAIDPANDTDRVGSDLEMAVRCLVQLDRQDEIDALLEKAIRSHGQNWRLLLSAAQSYTANTVAHHGFLVAGAFQRGPKRGGGQPVGSDERDRVRALQLMVQAMPLVLKDEHSKDVSDFFLHFVDVLGFDRSGGQAWRLQYLSDLKVLPDYEQGGRRWGWRPTEESRGAPVDAEGRPIFYHVPTSLDAAENDGQRWRWCLQQVAERDPERLNSARMRLASFLESQFGVHTIADAGWPFGREQTDDTREDQTGPYALHTLAENETIARLATGIRRFSLPDEFNPIKIYQAMANDDGDAKSRIDALESLARVFENRRQYPKAAGYWRRLLDDFPDEKQERRESWRLRLDRIVGAWGRFEPNQTQPAGCDATLEYRFRNGRQVTFTAHQLNTEELLADIKAYLKSNPRELDWGQLNLDNLGYRIVRDNQRQYLGPEVARWQLTLEPRQNHFDTRTTVATRLQKPGAYLVEAQMAGGNTCFVVVWVDDTVILKKPLDGKTYYFVADAATGRPVPNANVEFFGWQHGRVNRARPPATITRQFAERTDANGQVIPDPDQQVADCQWLITARTAEGRFAYLGFTRIWRGVRRDARYDATKAYALTDRPVYRPEQKVHYKFWIGRARYDAPETCEFANRDVAVEVHNPKGDKVLSETKRTDAFGGIEGDYLIPADATLGVFAIVAKLPHRNVQLGGGRFRVEEYKKPEFEVTVDAPATPIILGQKITATIKARYYFGSPVTQAKVKCKVIRTSRDEPWFPAASWDWLYGPGYGWFASDYDWYPGWQSWGCPRPAPAWWPRRQSPPEVVVEQEVPMGPDGVVNVEIDTAVAKAIHPDQDHAYTITAEVVDASRRTIVGTGNVLVARKPFTVQAWLDRGYLRVGDAATAHFSARTLDGRPVQGHGELRLLKIAYREGKPVETPVQTWTLDTDAEGLASQQLMASQSGQYRLSYKLTSQLASPASGKGVEGTAIGPPSKRAETTTATIEGGCVFTIVGDQFDGSQFRFNHLELIPDKREYAPGDAVKLQINTDRPGSTVLLFVRPVNGVYLQPKVLHLDGKSVIEEIGVAARDMPNFFIEADTIADGRLYTEVRQIFVPPEKRILNVEIQPGRADLQPAAVYKPGEKAKVLLKLTDLAGRPFVGSSVVAIYDKSLEYVSGGSNVPDIREFFWRWRRHHEPQGESTLDRWFPNTAPPNTIGMEDLGGFDIPFDDAEPKRRFEAGANGMGAMPRMAASPATAARPSDAAPRIEPTVRRKFADTALWVGAVTTAADGTAQVSLDMPDNLTTWRIKVWALGQGTRVGQGFADVITRKDLIVRLESPRFFVQSDEVVLSAIAHNYLKTKKHVRLVLELEGGRLEPLLPVRRELVRPDTVLLSPEGQSREIEPNGEARVDWRVKVLEEGHAIVRVKALTDEESDAMEQRFPCYVHGMPKTESYSGALGRQDTSGRFTFTIPEKRRPEQSRLEVRWSPTLAGAMIDALPYLVDYPYGCTEQTLNRFLPTVLTQKILLEMEGKAGHGGAALTASPSPANERGKDGDRNARQVANRLNKRIFDQAEVTRMVKQGVERLTEMQCSDGGWGWFSGWGEHSDAHTTALVVHGLQIAQQNGVALVPGVLERGVAWLVRYEAEQLELLNRAAEQHDQPIDRRPRKASADNLDAFVAMVLTDAGQPNAEMRDFLYRDRTRLAVYALTMYGMALEQQGEKQKLAMVLRNLGQYVQEDEENQTAWLRLPQDSWWHWYGSEFEAHAYYLKLLARTDPHGSLAPRIVKYLLNNRKHATYWNSTRDTALCIEAMADFLRRSGENRPQVAVEVYFDGRLQKTVEITPHNLFTFDNRFVLEGHALATGQHTIELRKQGVGPLYYTGCLSTFTLEDFIHRAGLEIKVNRKYYKLIGSSKLEKAAGSRGQPVEQRTEKYAREELASDAQLKSGDLVEIELEIDSKNDYEHLIFEDMKPAGFEPVDLRSGYTGNAIGAYVEFRDNRVVFFARTLARGKHSVSYRMRAETPGRFSALPTRVSAMYAPDLKGNSDEIKLEVRD